ncbi:MAG: aminotransferase class I/II-fold pyridoxal phosphate-dependent enzyme [Phycisphaerales bacterium]|nr:aminotransferase class I/II-fold pyridoxal phosphate-dependent enzyme [Phycisphaerales bacterium]
MARNHITPALRPFGTSIFAVMTGLALEHDAVNLSQGSPDEDGPDFLKEAAARAMRDKPNQYAPFAGVPEFREALSDWWADPGGRHADPGSEITVTAGCTEAIAAALLGLLEPGDEVILFEPFYDSYLACIAIARAVPRFVPLRREGDGYAFDPDELRAAFTNKTRAIMVNTPHNPTGKVYTDAEMRLIADLCIEHGVTAITDEVYERLTYTADQGRPHRSLASIDGMADRTIALSSLGKTFSLTGWKIGWAIAPPALTAAVQAAHQFLIFTVAKPLQHGAAEAMADPGCLAWVENLRVTLQSRRDRLFEVLTRLGFGATLPDAGYFITADHTALSDPLGIEDDVTLCERMTKEAGVAAIPVSALCANKDAGRSLVRFSFCKSDRVLDEGIARLERWFGGA